MDNETWIGIGFIAFAVALTVLILWIVPSSKQPPEPAPVSQEQRR